MCEQPKLVWNVADTESDLREGGECDYQTAVLFGIQTAESSQHSHFHICCYVMVCQEYICVLLALADPGTYPLPFQDFISMDHESVSATNRLYMLVRVDSDPDRVSRHIPDLLFSSLAYGRRKTS